jgi:plasmid stabilization system protein ParE
VARVELSLTAIDRLDRMIVTHSLPADTRPRVQRSLRKLERFPSIGRQLDERWGDLRFIVGPWRWLVIVYAHDEREDVVRVLTIQDARSSTSVTQLIGRR